MATLHLSELHPIYQTVGPDEARMIANLGAEVYVTVREQLRTSWAAEMSVEEGVKAEMWRKEGRLSALGEVGEQLTAAEEAKTRLMVAEGTVSALRAAMEGEIARRVGEVLDGFRKDYEITKMREVTALKEQLAAAASQEKMVTLLTESNETLREKVLVLEADQAELVALKNKSSHVIGKEGEVKLYELLDAGVLSVFEGATLEDMTTVGHAADFHLRVVNGNGRRVKILVDSKKYKRAVNHDEIQKLFEDMDADEEGDGGLLVSLNSGIATKKQFQVGRTPKQKPVLFLSLQDYDVEMERNLLCWAVRSLVAVIGETDHTQQAAMLAKIEEFLAGINASVRDIDGLIRGHQKTLDGMKAVKAAIVKAVVEYRGGEAEEGCDAVLKSTGEKCGKKVTDGGKCKAHRGKGGS